MKNDVSPEEEINLIYESIYHYERVKFKDTGTFEEWYKNARKTVTNYCNDTGKEELRYLREFCITNGIATPIKSAW